MKVLWFTNTPCGAAAFLERNTVKGGWLQSLENQLKKIDGIDLHVAFFNNFEAAPFEGDKVYYYPIQTRKTNKIKRYRDRIRNFVETTEYVTAFKQVIDDCKPDIIHVHGTEFSFGILTQYITNIPIVISIQGNLTVLSNFYFRGISKSTVFRYDNLRDRAVFVNQYRDYRKMNKQAKQERKILKQTQYILGRTDWDNNITRVLAPNSTYMHCDEVLRKPFYLKRWNPDKLKDRKIITVCGANLFKGIEMAFKACILLTDLGRKDFTWQIAGIKRTNHIIDLCIKKYKVRPEDIGLELLGILEEEKLINTMLNSSLFVQNSHMENSPNSLCEAMILGMPVLASTAGGTQSLLRHDTEGWLIQDGDEIALAGAILRILDLPKEKIVQVTVNAYNRATKRHDAKAIAATLTNNYTRIIQSFKGQK